MRTWQKRTCTNCGHSDSREIKYPKYGASEVPLSDIAKLCRCTRCRVRGQVIINEGAMYFDAKGPITKDEARRQIEATGAVFQ